MTTYIVECYTPSDWPHVATLIETWPFKPHAGHARWPAKRMTALCLARATGTLQNSESVGWIALSADTILGFTSLSVLPWDSGQIGLPAARIDYLVATGNYVEQHQIKEALLSTALQYATRHGVRHLSVRLNASDLSGLHALEQAGFITVDSILTFALDVSDMPLAELNGDIDIRLAIPSDGAATAELARQAYVYDRFHSDPYIPSKRADELHATWLRNSCAGGAADAVVLAEKNQSLLGFVTCKLQRDTKTHLGELIGAIVLVATTKEARRRGIARATTLAALDWFRQQDAVIVEVGTQVRNIPASRLYESCGFRLINASTSLRKLL